MSLRRKLIVGALIAISGVAAVVGYQIIYTVQHVDEAYAAWDTGTLLVEYMKSHDDRWPSSWDDPLSLVRNDSEHRIILRGASAGDVDYASRLQKVVTIDWQFDPSRNGHSSPVTRPDGTEFPIVWKGAEPNEMVYAYFGHNSMRHPPATF
jgi:hypothetical protein